ncbi:helix-turn-helix domain-containing protein [Corynebacterium comes]|uniref:Anaerobic benzoate catabolism transcriptional regulator n=1 Tax=Corynebacterium comes TaxID=2675218 RepID=A0A6B8W2L0_9CORY|nr:helix-turn-helix transcriptional regulator [Corynebacterium comes]QGU03870.1 anaerobic benzoate catabolism transcriptional regulator [Corynebacterium comes]
MAQRSEWKPWPSYGLRLGRNLYTLRRMRGLTQEQLASLSDVSRNSISNIERNLNNAGTATDPHLSIVYRLARALDVPPAALLPGGDHPVADICSAEKVGISIRWPESGDDLRPFRRTFAQQGSGPRYEDEPPLGEVGLPQVVDEPGRKTSGPKGIEGRGPVTE